jgi:hypothetical protein
MVWGLHYKVKLQARALCQDRYGKLAGLIPQCGEAEAGSVQSSQLLEVRGVPRLQLPELATRLTNEEDSLPSRLSAIGPRWRSRPLSSRFKRMRQGAGSLPASYFISYDFQTPGVAP